MSIMVSFCVVFFPRGVLDEILNLIESVSEGFPSYFCQATRAAENGTRWKGIVANSSMVSRRSY